MSARITKDMLRFAARAYEQMKDLPVDEYPPRSVHESRHGEETCIEHQMFRRHWYYGEWVYFARGFYACTFDAGLLADLAARDAVPAQVRHTNEEK